MPSHPPAERDEARIITTTVTRHASVRQRARHNLGTLGRRHRGRLLTHAVSRSAWPRPSCGYTRAAPPD